ncbi:MAG: hypothetical protein OEV94_09035 [Deltaproteobacteria bacterium]|nr:hypothetical protein [Deltaproteobacteria bacterium]
MKKYLVVFLFMMAILAAGTSSALARGSAYADGVGTNGENRLRGDVGFIFLGIGGDLEYQFHRNISAGGGVYMANYGWAGSSLTITDIPIYGKYYFDDPNGLYLKGGITLVSFTYSSALGQKAPLASGAWPLLGVGYQIPMGDGWYVDGSVEYWPVGAFLPLVGRIGKTF